MRRGGRRMYRQPSKNEDYSPSASRSSVRWRTPGANLLSSQTASGTSSADSTSTSTPAAGAIARAGMSLPSRHSATARCLDVPLTRNITFRARLSRVTVLAKPEQDQIEVADRAQRLGVCSGCVERAESSGGRQRSWPK